MMTAAPPHQAASPELIAALLVLERVPSEQLPWIAAEWLVAGQGGIRTSELAGLSGRDVREARDLLPSVLEELGISVPSTRGGAAVYFSHLAALRQAGLVGEQPILMAVETIDAGAYEPEVHDPPLGSLYGVIDEWDGEWGRTRDQLRLLVSAACQQQLALYPVVLPPD
jgi:hypothetical protein